MSKPARPLKRNWKKGTQQIGLFIRTEDGSTIELVVDNANPTIKAAAALVLAAFYKLPPR